MLRVAVGLVVCAFHAKSQDTASIVQKVVARYTNLDGYRLEGSFETMSGGLDSARGVSSGTGKFVIEAAEKTRKLHIAFNGPVACMTIISNGSTTWTYLPKEKAYAKVEAVTDSGDDEEEQTDTDNPALNMYKLVVRAYSAFDKLASRAQLAREQDVKTAEGKVRCWVLEMKTPNRIEKDWIDQQTGLVLRSELDFTSQGVERFTFSLKRFETDMPPESEFAFTPAANVRLVDELDLPGRPAFIGRPAADFVLKNIDGEPMRLSDLRGKIVVLDFWATWCPPCRQELPVINKLAARLRDKNVVFLGINDEGASTVKSFNKKHEYTFTTLEDTNRKVHHAYQANAIPSVFVIGADGIVRKHFVGSREEPELLAAITAAQSR